ncbi:TLC domain-containing protein 4-B-like [Branchiostoma floridae]|uniref:TLC domain-containing protein 4-B-like n=1 Tax=Branchiostoma floridae TaxID=7739 RepID=A0A9J7LU73_BRAFL|nr:TLC domain-containing protein 4-B-like [Branchiostoma floridae]
MPGYDFQTISTKAGSVIFHLAISEWLSSPLLRKLVPAFGTLPSNKQVVLRNSVMSTVHAAITGGFKHLPYFATSNALGFLVADSLLMAMYVPIRDWKLTLHHTVAIWGAHNVMVAGAGLYFGNTWFLMEVSNPFVNMRLILHTLGHKRSLLYKVNGVAMLVAFFAFRIATIPIYFGLVPHMRTGEFFKMELGPIIKFLFISPIFCMLNIFWFTKICKGAYRVLYSSETGSELFSSIKN